MIDNDDEDTSRSAETSVDDIIVILCKINLLVFHPTRQIAV